MSLPLTPAILRAAYEFLRCTPPFRSWRLPPGEAVKFHVTRHKNQEGDFGYTGRDGPHVYRVSANTIGYTHSLLVVMAHEMVHGRQAVLGLPLAHNATFHQLSARVCKHHGWDIKTFVR